MGNNLSVSKQSLVSLVSLCEQNIEILHQIDKFEDLPFPQMEYETNLVTKPDVYILNDRSFTYLSSLGMEAEDINKIEYNSLGKPFLKGMGKDFSISHTQLRPSDVILWGCLVGDKMVGLDLQANRKVNWLKISEKHFSHQEYLFIKKNGKNGFFQIWTRREALGKALGKGFFYESEGTVSDEGHLMDKINVDGETLEIVNFKLGENIWGAYCFVV